MYTNFICVFFFYFSFMRFAVLTSIFIVGRCRCRHCCVLLPTSTTCGFDVCAWRLSSFSKSNEKNGINTFKWQKSTAGRTTTNRLTINSDNEKKTAQRKFENCGTVRINRDEVRAIAILKYRPIEFHRRNWWISGSLSHQRKLFTSAIGSIWRATVLPSHIYSFGIPRSNPI